MQPHSRERLAKHLSAQQSLTPWSGFTPASNNRDRSPSSTALPGILKKRTEKSRSPSQGARSNKSHKSQYRKRSDSVSRRRRRRHRSRSSNRKDSRRSRRRTRKAEGPDSDGSDSRSSSRVSGRKVHYGRKSRRSQKRSLKQASRILNSVKMSALSTMSGMSQISDQSSYSELEGLPDFVIKQILDKGLLPKKSASAEQKASVSVDQKASAAQEQTVSFVAEQTTSVVVDQKANAIAEQKQMTIAEQEMTALSGQKASVVVPAVDQSITHQNETLDETIAELPAPTASSSKSYEIPGGVPDITNLQSVQETLNDPQSVSSKSYEIPGGIVENPSRTHESNSKSHEIPGAIKTVVRNSLTLPESNSETAVGAGLNGRPSTLDPLSALVTPTNVLQAPANPHSDSKDSSSRPYITIRNSVGQDIKVFSRNSVNAQTTAPGTVQSKERTETENQQSMDNSEQIGVHAVKSRGDPLDIRAAANSARKSPLDTGLSRESDINSSGQSVIFTNRIRSPSYANEFIRTNLFSSREVSPRANSAPRHVGVIEKTGAAGTKGNDLNVDRDNRSNVKSKNENGVVPDAGRNTTELTSKSTSKNKEHADTSGNPSAENSRAGAISTSRNSTVGKIHLSNQSNMLSASAVTTSANMLTVNSVANSGFQSIPYSPGTSANMLHPNSGRGSTLRPNSGSISNSHKNSLTVAGNLNTASAGTVGHFENDGSVSKATITSGTVRNASNVASMQTIQNLSHSQTADRPSHSNTLSQTQNKLTVS